MEPPCCTTDEPLINIIIFYKVNTHTSTALKSAGNSKLAHTSLCLSACFTVLVLLEYKQITLSLL